MFSIRLIPVLIGVALGCYTNSRYVREMTPETLDLLSELQHDNLLWIVHFYRESDQNLSSTVINMEKIGNEMVDYITVGAININRYPLWALTVMQITQTPNFYFYGYYKHTPDSNPNLNSLADIAAESSKQLIDLFESRARRRFVANRRNEELKNLEKVQYSMHAWLVVYYQSDTDCVACDKLGAIWGSLVEAFGEKIKFASINPGEGVEMIYPQVQFYPKGNKQSRVPETLVDAVDLEYGKLCEYLDGKIKYPKVTQITSASTAASCLERKRCIFAFLDPDQDSSCRLDALRTLRYEAKRGKRRSWRWMWNEFGAQPDVERLFAVGDDHHETHNGTIVVVALHVRRALYTKRHFERRHDFQESFFNFISNVTSHDFHYEFTVNATQLPNIRNVKPWITKDHKRITHGGPHDEL